MAPCLVRRAELGGAKRLRARPVGGSPRVGAARAGADPPGRGVTGRRRRARALRESRGRACLSGPLLDRRGPSHLPARDPRGGPVTRRLARAALFALLSSGVAATDGTAATSLFIKNHVNSNDVRGIAPWGGVLAAATTGGVVTVVMPAGPLGFTLASPGGLATNQTLGVGNDPTGDLWIGTVDQGVARESPAGRWRRALTTFDGLPSERVQALPRAGDSVWVGTDGGAALFAENRS